MSPRPAAPSSASISAWASTSPSEWPARPRGESIATPPRTRGTPASNACASIPIPTRWSDKRERLRQLVERLDADVGLVGTVLDERPRPTPKMHGDEAGRARRHDVVVDAVADVGDLARGEARVGDHALEELRSRLLDPPARRRSDDVDREPPFSRPCLEVRALVAGDAEEVAASTEPLEAGPRVRVEVVSAVDDLLGGRLG